MGIVVPEAFWDHVKRKERNVVMDLDERGDMIVSWPRSKRRLS
jgi:hypothetical protein